MATTSNKDCVFNTANAITVETDCYVQNSLLKGVLLNIGNTVRLNPKPYLGDYKPLLEEFLQC